MTIHRIIGNYLPSTIVGAVIFWGVMLFVWPAQDFVAKFK